VGVLEWAVCKQQDEQLTCLGSTAIPVCLVNEHCAVLGNDAVLIGYSCRAKARSITYSKGVFVDLCMYPACKALVNCGLAGSRIFLPIIS
jgi:hypothetical protein